MRRAGMRLAGCASQDAADHEEESDQQHGGDNSKRADPFALTVPLVRDLVDVIDARRRLEDDPRLHQLLEAADLKPAWLEWACRSGIHRARAAKTLDETALGPRERDDDRNS